MDLYWLTQAVAYWSLVLFFIPPYYIKKLMLFLFRWICVYMDSPNNCSKYFEALDL